MTRKKLIKTVIRYVAFFLIPAVLFYLEAFFTYDPFERTGGTAQFLNIIFLEMVLLILWMVIGNAVWALRIETLFVLICGIANYYVISFRGNPIVPWDFLSLKTVASVAGEYSYAMEKKQIGLILIFLVLFIGEHFISLRVSDKAWKQRVITGVLSFGVIFFMTRALWQDSFVSKCDLYPFLFTPNAMYERNGFAVTFLMDLQYLNVEKPEGYSEEEAAATLASYEDGFSWTGDDTYETTETLPNVIVVMDEAFSDVGILGDFAASEDYMPFMHELEQGYENTITGNLHVSVKGGNTANTEFEFLTGDTMKFLPAGSIPYQQYLTGETPSLASYLKRFGYETYAMHPYYATGWNRDKVYPWFGFDEFLDKDDFTAASYLRGYVDDQSCVEKIINIYKQKGDAPLFIFNVTMQNHSPYTDGYVDANGNITVEKSSSATLSEYLTLIKKSDEALKTLITYFEQQDEPTVIIFFGDHQPTDSVVSSICQLNGKDVGSLTKEEEADRYIVPYVIWANYEIEAERGTELSANYLGAYAMRAAGIPLSDYQNYLLELAEKYPVVSTQATLNASGDRVDGEDEGLYIYQQLQYYLLFE